MLDSEGDATVTTEQVMQSADWNSATYGSTKIGNVEVTSIKKTKGTAEKVTVASDGTVTIAPASGN